MDIKTVPSEEYRADIDGLRALAVIAVIIFHLGHLPYGFLGVDVFFVISGYLITKIIFRESIEDRFSIINFYLRRIRRILPLVAFVCLVALIIGAFVMLPDDLENLAQSVVATTFFSNNILQAITTKNYWDVINEFKPLMHTWSLGVEEQYYMFYPFIFLATGKKRASWNLPILAGLTILSIALYLSPYFSESDKFYYLPFRFFELSLGGIVAIYMGNKLFQYKMSFIPICLLALLLVYQAPYLGDSGQLILLILVTCALLITANSKDRISAAILQNRLFVGIGKISFSLYMWHQVVLAFYRYLSNREIDLKVSLYLSAIFTILSIFSYKFIEQPFRNKKTVKTPILLGSLSVLFGILVLFSLYIYANSGVLKDVPELNIYKDNVQRGMHAEYNNSVYSYDKEFTDKDNIKVFIMGNSFARDWANILMESDYSEMIEISYMYNSSSSNFKFPNELAHQADVIFICGFPVDSETKADPIMEKTWYIGIKNFGINNGAFYNYRGNDYLGQRTHIDSRYYKIHENLSEEWGDQYIDLFANLIDSEDRMPVFTPNGKFISQDTRHLTKDGAKFYAESMDEEIREVLGIKENQP